MFYMCIILHSMMGMSSGKCQDHPKQHLCVVPAKATMQRCQSGVNLVEPVALPTPLASSQTMPARMQQSPFQTWAGYVWCHVLVCCLLPCCLRIYRTPCHTGGSAAAVVRRSRASENNKSPFFAIRGVCAPRRIIIISIGYLLPRQTGCLSLKRAAEPIAEGKAGLWYALAR